VPAAYSSDLRERVVHIVGEGTSRRGAAGVFKVSVSTAIRWTKRLATTGSCAPLSGGGGDHRSKALEQHRDWLLALVDEEPDATLAETQTRLSDPQGLRKSVSCLWRFFRRHDVTFKKTPHAAERDRPDVKAAREAWRKNQMSLDPAHLVCTDETATSTNMTRLRGRSRQRRSLRRCGTTASPRRWSLTAP
jgi:transposase